MFILNIIVLNHNKIKEREIVTSDHSSCGTKFKLYRVLTVLPGALSQKGTERKEKRGRMTRKSRQKH